jgi:hypothetical protein
MAVCLFENGICSVFLISKLLPRRLLSVIHIAVGRHLPWCTPHDASLAARTEQQVMPWTADQRQCVRPCMRACVRCVSFRRDSHHVRCGARPHARDVPHPLVLKMRCHCRRAHSRRITHVSSLDADTSLVRAVQRRLPRRTWRRHFRWATDVDADRSFASLRPLPVTTNAQTQLLPPSTRCSILSVTLCVFFASG